MKMEHNKKGWTQLELGSRVRSCNQTLFGKENGLESFLAAVSTAFLPSLLRPGWMISLCASPTTGVMGGI